MLHIGVLMLYISVLMLYLSLRLIDLNFYSCDVFVLTKKGVQKDVYRNFGLFLLWGHIKVS